MNEREILEQRVVTLAGLLRTPGGPLGTSGGKVGEKLQEAWTAERLLLQRILAETEGTQVRPTIEAWFRRTAQFIEASSGNSPSWVDREGASWDARLVLEHLEDLTERLDSWSESRGVPDHDTVE